MSETWTVRPDLPTTHGLYAAGAGRDDRYFHVIGGETTPLRHDIFDERTQTWTQVANLPANHKRHRAEVFDGLVFIFAPEGDPASMIVYDPSTDGYATLTDIPVSLFDRASFMLNDIIYIAGGYTGTTESTRVDSYNPVTDTYTLKASLPSARRIGSGVAGEGKGYVIGGIAGLTDNLTLFTEYDPDTDAWTARDTLSVGRNAIRSIAARGRIWAAMGVIGGSATDDVERYDIASDAWTTLTDAPFLSTYPAWATIDGGLHVAQSGEHWRFDAYEPETEGWGVHV